MRFIEGERFKQIKEVLYATTRTLKLVWNVDHRMFIGIFATGIVPAIVPFVNIYIYKLIIDLVIESVNKGTYDTQYLYTLIALRVATYFIEDGSYRLQDYVLRLFWTKVPIFMNQLALGKLSSLSIQYFENSKFRDLMERAKDSLSGLRPQELVMAVMYGLQSLVQLTIGFVAIAQLSWFFVGMVVLITIPEFINQSVLSKFTWGIWDANASLRKRFDYLNRMLVGPREAKELRIFKLAKSFLNELKVIQLKFYADNKVLAKKGFASGLVVNGLGTLIFVGIEVYVVFLALAKKVTVGDIGFYTGTVTNFHSGLSGFLRNINKIFESSLYVKSLFEVLDSEDLVKVPDKPIRINLLKPPVIEFKNVSFTYPGSNHKILNNFSLTLNPGEKVAFVGENGAGKSTIVKLLVRFYDVDQGEILINGVNIKDSSLNDWYESIGVLFQDFNRYDHSVKENIRFGKVDEDADLEKIIIASVSAGSHDFITRYENGYEQMLGKVFEGGIEPSSGQWQKLALARAFFRNSPVLILDEPTASIDAKAEAEIFSKVEKLSKSKTVIIISHRFSTVRNADKIYVMDRGKIQESGTHEALMRLDGQYAKLFKLQAKGYQ